MRQAAGRLPAGIADAAFYRRDTVNAAFVSVATLSLLSQQGRREDTGANSAHPGTTRTKTYDVDVPFMQLERHGWDIHAV